MLGVPTAAVGGRGIPRGWLGARLRAWHKQIAAPARSSPGPRGSSEQPLRSRSRPPPAQAREHVRPPQPTSPAVLPALAEGGLLAAAAWQLGSSPPKHSKSQRWGAFPELAAASIPAPCRGHLCPPPRCHAVPPAPCQRGGCSPARPCQAVLGAGSRCHALPTLPMGLAAAVGSRESLLGCSACASLEGAQERGCSLRYQQMSAFPDCSDREPRICRRALGGEVRPPRCPLSPATSRQADIEQLDPRGRTPLHLATTLGHLECARVLLKHGADVGKENRSGWTGEPGRVAAASVLHQAALAWAGARERVRARAREWVRARERVRAWARST